MSFLSLQFLIFFLITFAGSYFLRGRARIIFLVVASWIFYAYWDYRFLLILILQTVISYVIGLLLGKYKEKSLKSQKVILGIGCTLLIIILAVFKYFNFFVESFCSLFSLDNSGVLQVILPIGVSFYTFQALSYIIDVYRNDVAVEKDFSHIALYIGFFPQVVSGPIVRSLDMLPQIANKKPINKDEVWSGIQIFLLGVVMKFVIADRLAVGVDAVYSAPSAYSGLSILIAVVGYSLQLYCDFAGYSHMAIGIAKLLGFDLGQNFNLPYMSANPTEFWKRWHISLSTWLMKYLYIPLGGNRKGKIRTKINLFLTMVIGGFWHGANWTYIVWGALHGVALIVHKDFKKLMKGSGQNNKIVHWLCVLLNFIFVTICWIFFRADSISDAWLIICRLFTWADGVQYIYIYTLIFFVLIFGVNIFVYCKNNGNGFYCNLKMEKFSSKVILCVAVMLIFLFLYISSNPFIYAQF